jgi:hypothetical protein
MAHPTPYFDLLEDGLVEEVITRIPRGEYFQQGWVALSASSRRLCTLVGGVNCAPSMLAFELHLPKWWS